MRTILAIDVFAPGNMPTHRALDVVFVFYLGAAQGFPQGDFKNGLRFLYGNHCWRLSIAQEGQDITIELGEGLGYSLESGNANGAVSVVEEFPISR